MGHNWSDKLYKKYLSLNDTDVVEVPLLIRDEYLKIFEMLSRNQIHGAFFQIKDTFEIVLKSLVLIVVVELIESELNEEDDIVFKLFEKPLSLGDWESICRLLKNKSKYKEINLLIDATLKMFSKTLVVKWRNDFFGHGASLNPNDEVFINDITEKIEVLNLFFKENRVNYSVFKFDNHNQVSFIYKDKTVLNLDYFFEYNDEKIYLFDSYKPYQKKVAMLNYSSGDKITKEMYRINNLVNRLQIESESRKFISTLRNDVYLACEDSVLNDILKVNDFIRPESIINKIENFIEVNDKGILLLQMEKGMGKTTFSKSIDELSWRKVKLHNCVIRGYYVNDTYKSRKNVFISEMNDLFRIDDEGKIIYKGNLPNLNEQNDKLKEELVALLSYYRLRYFEDTGKSKLIFFVDGLDEIVNHHSGSIFDCLPDELDLDENIYIIYTSRTDDELEASYFNRNSISKIHVTRKLELKRENKEYKDTLEKFLEKKYKGIKREEISDYIDKSESIFLYLKRICNVLDSSREITNKHIISNQYYEIEVDILRSNFGDKYFDKIIKILLILIVFREPIGIQSIAGLLGGDVSFELLYFIMHLRLYLGVSRTNSGNKVLVEDKDFVRFLKGKYKSRIIELADEFIMKSYNFLSSGDESNEYMPDVYITSNLDNLLEYSNIELSIFCDDDIVEKLLDIDEKMPRNSLESLKKLTKLQAQISMILNSYKNQNMKIRGYKAILGSNQAEVYDLLGYTDAAYSKFHESVKILNRLDINKFPKKLLLSSRTYIKYALLCIKTDNNDMAIISLDNALKLYNNLAKIKAWSPKLEDLLPVFNNKGIAYQNKSKYDDAIDEYQKGISMIEEKTEVEEKYYLMISMIYLNRGVAYSSKGDSYIEHSKLDFIKALEYSESDHVDQQTNHVKILLNISRINVYEKDLSSALKNIEKGILICENLKESDLFVDDDILMRAYFNRGIILLELDKNDLALISFHKAVDIGLTLRRENRYFDKYEFFKSFVQIAEMYKKSEDYISELDTYERMLNFSDFESRKLFDLNIFILCNYLVCKKSIGEEDIILYDKLIEIYNKKKDELTEEEVLNLIALFEVASPLFRLNKLYNKDVSNQGRLIYLVDLNDPEDIEKKALCIKEKGYCLVKDNQIDEGLKLYNKSIEILLQLKKDKVLKSFGDLGTLYFNRSMIYYKKASYQNAFDDIYNATQVINYCLENSIHIDLDLVKASLSFMTYLINHQIDLNIEVY